MAGTLLAGKGVEGPSGPLPRSGRWPWTRAGLSGVVALMVPFTWVLQIDGCTEMVEGRATGYDLLRDLDFTWPDAALAAVLFVVAILTPKAAAFAETKRGRVWIHVAGLVATAVLVARGISLVTGTTQIRSVQPAGIIVLLALLGAFADAVARVARSTMERMDADRRVRERGG